VLKSGFEKIYNFSCLVHFPVIEILFEIDMLVLHELLLFLECMQFNSFECPLHSILNVTSILWEINFLVISESDAVLVN